MPCWINTFLCDAGCYRVCNEPFSNHEKSKFTVTYMLKMSFLEKKDGFTLIVYNAEGCKIYCVLYQVLTAKGKLLKDRFLKLFVMLFSPCSSSNALLEYIEHNTG